MSVQLLGLGNIESQFVEIKRKIKCVQLIQQQGDTLDLLPHIFSDLTV